MTPARRTMCGPMGQFDARSDEVGHMQMTKYSDYSLRALIYLGLNRHRRCTIREIADAYGISENHLMKLVHQLGQEGFITTIRGKNGGLELAMPASEINLGEVFRATEGNCPAGRVLRRTGEEHMPDRRTVPLDRRSGDGPAGLPRGAGSIHARGHAEAGTGISAHLRGQRREQALIVTGGWGFTEQPLPEVLRTTPGISLLCPPLPSPWAKKRGLYRIVPKDS